jgi:signal peptidase II
MDRNEFGTHRRPEFIYNGVSEELFLKRYLKSYILLAVIAGTIIALDIWTKNLVIKYVPVGEYWSPWPWLLPYARIIHISNTGVAFGMFQGFGDVFKYLSMIVALIIIIYYPRVPASDWTLRIAMGMQLGGALGNLIDRIRFGYVVDFVSVGNFAVFNVADSSITVGVVILLLGLWLQERKKKPENQAIADPTGAEPQPAKDESQID